MSDKSMTIEGLTRHQRSLVRQINVTKSIVNNAFAENPSEEVTFQIGAHLDEWKTNLAKWEDVINDMLELSPVEGKTSDQISKEEGEISKLFLKSSTEYATAKGKLSAMFARLKKSSDFATSRRSVDTSLVGEGNAGHALVKLPDIPVPKFDGKMKNFTEWHSLFSAMIDKNDSLQPVQKLYFLKQAMAALLKDHTLQEGAYESAFKYVEERYYNRRALIATHFHDLLELPPITFPTLREALDKVNAILRGLKVCKIDVEKMSPLIAYIVVRKLPDRLRTDWENSYLDHSSYPSFTPLGTFLQNRCFAFESVHPDATAKASEPKKSAQLEEKKKAKTTLAVTTKSRPSTQSSSHHPKCLLCEKDHYLSQCDRFLDKSIADRFTFVREKRLCSNCFRQYHTASVCNSSKCKKCGENHHTLLHREISLTSDNANSEKKSESARETAEGKLPKAVNLSTSASTYTCSQEIVMLPSAVVIIQIGRKKVKTRALIDPCSQLELVSESFVRRHRIITKATLGAVQSVSTERYETSLSVSLNIQSRYTDFKLSYEANVVGQVPYQITHNLIERVQNLDPSLNLAECDLPHSSVDLLIGAQYSNQILKGERKFFGNFALQDSVFGWVTEGPLRPLEFVNTRCCNLTVKVEQELLKFFEVEEVQPPMPVLGERERCEAHFNTTYTRLENGKFQVCLPREKPLRAIANTYAQAKSSLLRFERRLDDETRKMYVDFMIEYRELNHMREAIDMDIPRYFIPHLFVLRLDSSSTKFRAVFNASAANQSGLSLNQALMVGPSIQPELFDTILRFRSYPIAFSADISKMYRQIQVHPDDWPLQSILWRDNPNQPIKIYELMTVTYGTSPASYIATRCLQVIGKQIEADHPAAAHAITSEFYMDDLLTGAETVSEALIKRATIHKMLQGAHFPLRKYISNSPEFLAALDSDLVEPLQAIEFAPTGAAKILGLQWEPATDCFSIRTNVVDLTGVVLTKRVVASLAAQAFDPTGFVAPIIIRAKILLQDLWREGKTWDEPIDPELAKTFRTYYEYIATLGCISIPRFYQTYRDSKFTIVGFSDASPRAYGAAIYLRTKQQAKVHSILISAKSKVALQFQDWNYSAQFCSPNSSEIQALRVGHGIPSHSTLSTLNPFLDGYGILRVGGRLSHSHLSEVVKHPIILSRKSSLVATLARHYHEKYFHASKAFVISFIQSRFWIIGGLPRIAKKVIRLCVFCTRLRSQAATQLMGELPKERVTVSRPFANVGVDLAGPFTIRCTNHRSQKHLKYYTAVFVCLATRTVHLEYVSDLSANNFIATLQRFAARKGLPHTIWSDNATNFVGAHNIIERHCQSSGINWKFIPARSPRQGGIWEAAVKAMKKHLIAVAGHVVLTVEQFETILSQIESILNSRPLYQQRETSDPDQIDVLTPGHFLVGSHLLHPAQVETHSVQLSERSEIQTRIVKSFWALWSKSYLAQLQSRVKWQSPAENLRVGDIVVLKDENSPPLQWKLGRISQTFPDNRGRVRVVEVFSNGSMLSRAIQKLVKLPIEASSD